MTTSASDGAARGALVKKCQPRALTPFLDRELSDDLREEISDHLRRCPTCGTLLDELHLASQQVRSMGRAEIPRTALQPALEVLADRAGLVRGRAINLPGTIATVGPPRGDSNAHTEEAKPTSKPPEAPEAPEPPGPLAGSTVLGSEASSSGPDAPLSATAMYEWSDPEQMHSTEASTISDREEMETTQVEQELPLTSDRYGVLPEHPNPPPAEIRPPWMEPATGEDDDLDEVGRRAIDESIGAAEETATAHDQPAREIEPSDYTAETPKPESAGREVAPTGLEPDRVDSQSVEAPPPTGPEGFWSRPAPTPAAVGSGLGSLRTQLRIGLVSALVLIVLAAAILYAGRTARPVSTGSTRSTPTHQSTRSPATSPTQTTAPSVAPSAPGAPAPAGQLTEVVTAGSGGSGWHLSRVRSGSPGGGVTRIVFDLEGGGPAPDARLGRGPDGAVYLTAAGISISPAEMSGFAGAGPITGMTQTGPSGLALRLATSGNPGFSMGYLSAPTRLVLDFK